MWPQQQILTWRLKWPCQKINGLTKMCRTEKVKCDKFVDVLKNKKKHNCKS